MWVITFDDALVHASDVCGSSQFGHDCCQVADCCLLYDLHLVFAAYPSVLNHHLDSRFQLSAGM